MDANLDRLTHGDPRWKVLYRHGGGWGVMEWLAVFLFVVAGLMVLAFCAAVAIAVVHSFARAGGFVAGLKAAWKAFGCGLFLLPVFGLFFFFTLAMGWGKLMDFWKDRSAAPEVVRCKVEALEEVKDYRGRRILYLTLEERRFSVTEEVFQSLKKGQRVVAEFKPYGPTLLVLLARERD